MFLFLFYSLTLRFRSADTLLNTIVHICTNIVVTVPISCTSVANPDNLNPDPYPAFHLNPDPYPAFHLNPDLYPDPLFENDEVLK